MADKQEGSPSGTRENYSAAHDVGEGDSPEIPRSEAPHSILVRPGHHDFPQYVQFAVPEEKSKDGSGSSYGSVGHESEGDFEKAAGSSYKYSEKSPLLLSSRDMSVGIDPGIGSRHLVTFLCFLGCGMSYGLRSHFSVALVAMVTDQKVFVGNNNETSELVCPGSTKTQEKSSEEGEFDWDANTQGIVLSAFFYGALATQLLGGIIAERFGGKRVLGFGVFLPSVLTLLTPPIARYSVTLLIIARVLEGVGEGMTIPAMYVILSKWSPRLERTQFGAFAMAGGNIGNVVGLALTGILADESVGGWPAAFYVFGAMGLAWVIVWTVVVHESPLTHPTISVSEQAYIITTAGDRQVSPPTPWRSILTSLPLWAIVAAHFGKNWVYFTLLTSLPTYMKQVLKFDISQNGVLSSMPYLAMWFVEIVGSQILDILRKRKLMSTTAARKGVNSLGVILTTVFLVVEAYAGCNQVLSVTMISLAMASLGLTSSGFQVNHLDIAPAFAGTLMGITNNFATIPGIVTPSVVSAITEAKPFVWRWAIVFIISALINLVGGVFFVILASGKEQLWARQPNMFQNRDFEKPDYPSKDPEKKEQVTPSSP